MRVRALSLSWLLCLLPAWAAAQDASTYALTAAAAEKFVRATQQLAASGGAPNVQGSRNPLDLSALKGQLDANPAAQRALADAGIGSAEYVAFMGAAMAATMVGQMEAAGMRGMLPPGITARPSQANIDFMKANMDLFQRSMTPGAPTGASAAGAAPAAASDDEALPVPPAAGAVLPSTLLARLAPLESITDGTDCTLDGLQDVVTTEAGKARALQQAFYGNPGDRGLARSAAEEAVLERAGDSAVDFCGNPMNFTPPAEIAAAEAERDRALGEIATRQQDEWNACPGISGGKEPACESAVNAAAARRTHEAERRYLAAAAQPFAAMVSRFNDCAVHNEAIVRDAKAADVRGANVQDVLRPLVVTYDQLPFVTQQWTSICETAQRYLVE